MAVQVVRKERTRCLLLAFVIMALCNSSRIFPQAIYGSITGNITDPSGAPIAGVTVTATQIGNQSQHSTGSNESGRYNLADLDPGVYDIKVTESGFRTFEITHLQLSVGMVARVDAQLSIGATESSITVQAAEQNLQTDKADIQDIIDSKMLHNLPAPIGRNYQGDLRTLPGFSVTGGGAVRGSNPAAAFSMNVNGVSSELNNTRIDGATATNNFLQGFTSYVPGLDAIQTVQVSMSSSDADTGLAGGASINVQIKSGTNELHGSLFEYHADNALKAKPAVFPAGQRQPKLIFNQFGGTIGGHVIKNKLFYFLSYDGVLSRQSYSSTTTVPTVAAKTGNLSEYASAIFDPSTGNPNGAGRTPFPGNNIPASRISQISRKILPLWPDPNLPGTANNYFVSSSAPYDRHTIDAKVNYNPTAKLTTSVRLGFLDWNEYYEPVFGTQLGGPAISGQQAGPANGTSVNLTGSVAYVFTPNFIIDGYFGFNRSYQNVLPVDIDKNIGLDFLGIPGTNGTRNFEGGWPLIRISGYTGIGVDQPYMPWIRHDPGYNYVLNFNWTKGNHNLRFGGEYSRRDLNHAQPEIEGQVGGAPGGFVFNPGVTQSTTGPASTAGNAFAAFLLGLPQQMGKTLQVPDQIQLRSNFFGGYVQDRWALTPKLTLNYGVRYEYLPLPTRPDRGVEFYEPSNNTLSLCGYNNIPRDCGVMMPKDGFSPRFGISYRINNTLVLRAGYSIARDPYDIGPRGVRTNYPLIIAQNFTGATSYTPVEDWKLGLPAIVPPQDGDGVLPVPNAVVVHAIPRNFRRGYIESRNISLEQQIGSSILFQVSYVGTLAIRKVTLVDLNAGQIPGAGIAGEPLYTKYGRTATTPMYSPFGTTNYNGLQVRIQGHTAHGLSAGAGYTWSKAIGNPTSSAIDTGATINSLRYFGRNRGVLDYNRTHVLNVTSTWSLPFGKGGQWQQTGLGAQIFGGWQLSGIFTAMSGLPFSVTASSASLNMPGSGQFADQIAPIKILGGHRTGNLYFDPSSFAPVTEARLGTSPKNGFRGPGLVNLDASLLKTFIATDRIQMQLRGDAFNVSNTPHWGLPANNISNGGFGVITGTDASYLGRAGTDERQFRLGLKVTF